MKAHRLLFAIVTCFLILRPAEGTEVVWVWTGAVTETSATVKARLSAPGESADLLFSPDSRLSDGPSVRRRSRVADSDGVVAFFLTGLTPDTKYFYRVESGGSRSERGAFHTFRSGPFSFRVALGSCATTGSEHRIFSTIRSFEPLFFLHMGDFHYEDIDRDDPVLFRDAYDEVLDSETQSELYRRVPIVYVWDDHDFGPDDSDRTAPGRLAAIEVYRQFVPHYPLERSSGGREQVETIQQAFTVGRVRFIVTDLRARRDPAGMPDGPEKSMMGEVQRRWFFEQLEKAAQFYPLVVWVGTVPWITRSGPNSEQGWELYSHERQLIANQIRRLGLEKKLVMLSGDAHMVAIDDGSHSNYSTLPSGDGRAFPILHAAPLDRYPRIKGGPYSHGTSPEEVLLGFLKMKQFGVMDVIDRGNSLEVTLSGHRSDGRLLEGLELKILFDEDGSRIVH